MTPEVIDRLFKPFVQADTSITRKFGGAGLGLAITQNLARLMGGDVELISRSGRGSEFTLTIRGKSQDDIHEPVPATSMVAKPIERPYRQEVKRNKYHATRHRHKRYRHSYGYKQSYRLRYKHLYVCPPLIPSSPRMTLQ